MFGRCVRSSRQASGVSAPGCSSALTGAIVRDAGSWPARGRSALSLGRVSVCRFGAHPELLAQTNDGSPVLP